MTKTYGNTHTTINIPLRVCSVAEENKGKKLFWMADGSAKQNRLTFSPCSESNLF